MRVLFISLPEGSFPFKIGGPAVVAYHLVREFDRKGLDVDFIFGIPERELCESGDLHARFGFSERVKIIPVVKNRRRPASNANYVDHKFFGDILRLSNRLFDHTDLVHFHCIPSSRDIIMPFLTRVKGIPTIFRAGGSPTYEAFASRDPWMYYNLFAFQLMRRMFTRVVCPSSYLKQKLILEGVDERRIEVIPNGVDLETFRRAETIELAGDPRLLFVGRLASCKGIGILVRSMKIVAGRMSGAVLHVVGDGELRSQLEQLVSSEGLTGKVILHGQVTSDLASFYRSADICVFPSTYEPFGITIIEAMAAGKPLIATPVGGVPENVKNLENGILITPTVRNLANAIMGLWKDKDLMRHMAEKNLEGSRLFDWSRVAQTYIGLYNRLIGRG